jgi:Mrp family chromosome partitioning ATPase
MTERRPDLVQRAAARLAKESQASTTSAPVAERRTFENAPRIDPIAEPVRNVERASYRESDSQRTVIISPTSLAAQGITLPGSAYSKTVEEFRAIKRQIITATQRARQNGGRNANILLVTSARPGDGKTFTSINIALAMAFEKDARVLLMDADAYRQAASLYLGITSEQGWVDVAKNPRLPIQGQILQTNIPGLSVLPAGQKSEEIPELMASERMTAIFDALVRDDPGRYIVVDALPCLASSEASILAGIAGQAIFVVAAHETSREDIEASLRTLSASPSVSLVLNKVEPVLTDQFDGYGYRYGYAYEKA